MRFRKPLEQCLTHMSCSKWWRVLLLSLNGSFSSISLGYHPLPVLFLALHFSPDIHLTLPYHHSIFSISAPTLVSLPLNHDFCLLCTLALNTSPQTLLPYPWSPTPTPCHIPGSPKTPRPLFYPNPAAASFRIGLNPLCLHSPPDLGSPPQQLQPQELHPLQPHLPQLPPDTCRAWNLRCGLRCSAGHPVPHCCLPRITRSAQRPGPLLCPSCLQDPSTRASLTSVAPRPEGQEAPLTLLLQSLCHHTPGCLAVSEEPCREPLALYHPPACSRCPRTSHLAPSLSDSGPSLTSPIGWSGWAYQSTEPSSWTTRLMAPTCPP